MKTKLNVVHMKGWTPNSHKLIAVYDQHKK